MTLSFSGAGLTIQTYVEALVEIQDDFRTRISARVATSAGSFMGQVQRIIALYDYRQQEKLQQLHQARDPRLASGVHLDIELSALGIQRDASAAAEVLGTITTTGTVSILDGSRVEVGGFVFATTGGPYARTGAGTITDVRVVSELSQAIDVSTLGAWTLLDIVADWTEFDDVSQPVAGRVVATDEEYRAAAEQERYARASGPLPALEAGLLRTDAVAYAKAYENVDRSNDPDADGIPYDAINVVVDGGEDQDVAEAIQKYGPAATYFHGAEELTVGTGARARVIRWDRPTDLDLYVRVTATTSTSEAVESALETAELEAAIHTALETFTTSAWVIGKDAIPLELGSAIIAAGVPALDALLIELSLDGVAYQTTKQAVTIRERALYAEARLTVVEN